MDKHLRLTITDTLGFWNDEVGDYIFNPNNTITKTYWYRLPEDWFGAQGLRQEKLGDLLAHLYGPNWQLGNEDGSKYIVLEVQPHMLSPEEAQARPWGKASGYTWTDQGLREASPDQL